MIDRNTSGCLGFALSTPRVGQRRNAFLTNTLGKRRNAGAVTMRVTIQQEQQNCYNYDGMTRRRAMVTLALLPASSLTCGISSAKAAADVRGGDDSMSFARLPCEGEGCRSVEIRDYRTGSGRAVERGSTIMLKWTGRLADRYGWPFQREPDEYVTLHVSDGELIEGFVQGILGMREGGKRRILIPTALGYHDETHGPLPDDFGDRRRLFATVLNNRRFKNAGDLVIDVQLKKVRPAA